MKAWLEKAGGGGHPPPECAVHRHFTLTITNSKLIFRNDWNHIVIKKYHY